jgi:hypothetical protein
MHWGHDPVLEKHLRAQALPAGRSVLTFFAQDSGTHNLVHATADTFKATQAREAIASCDHWKERLRERPSDAGQGPEDHHPARPRRTRRPRRQVPHPADAFTALTCHINALTGKDFKTVTLDRAGNFGQPAHHRVHEDPAVKLTAYPGTVRQPIVTGLGREAPTVIITNDLDSPARNLIRQYARRMTIEQCLAEIIRAFCADALSSTVNLNADLDIMLAVFAQTLLAALRARLPGYHAAAPDTIQRRFLETPGQITTTTVRLERRAYSPVPRTAGLPAGLHGHRHRR